MGPEPEAAALLPARMRRAAATPGQRKAPGPPAREASPATALVVVSTIVVAFALWCLRRPDQLLHPYVWSDEYHVLNLYQDHGLVDTIFSPLKGYFVWPTSASIGFAAWAGFADLPEVEYWLSTAWFVLTLCVLLLPRSDLRLGWRAGLALILVLAPMNPEVFGIVLYTFWWTSLWPLISFTWSRDNWWLRGPVLVIGGMSSIAGAALAIPSALVFIRHRRRRDLIATVVLGATLVAQTVAYLTSARSQQTPLYPGRVVLQELRNFSFYVLSWWRRPDPAVLDAVGAVLLAAIVAALVLGASRRWGGTREVVLTLAVTLLVVGVISAVPAPLVTNPTGNGPRYYFLPFVVIGWLLFLIAVTSRWRWVRLLAAAAIIVSLVGLNVDFSRHEKAASWSAQLAQCRTAQGPFYVPVQFTGTLSQMWRTALVITPATCRRLGYPPAALGPPAVARRGD